MKRKKWTPNPDVTDAVLVFREKRKWQMAMRRYILDKQLTPQYAPYFGISISQFRNWIELQFAPVFTWDDFGTAWQFEHIVPIAYFNFFNNEEMKVCWNFTNIRVEMIEKNKPQSKYMDIVGAKPYFNSLYEKTGYQVCLQMLEKIAEIESVQEETPPLLVEFMINHKEELMDLKTLSAEEFSRLNIGMSLSDLLLEREILKKFS